MAIGYQITAEMRFLRRINVVTERDGLRNDDISRKLIVQLISNLVFDYRNKWISHLQCMQTIAYQKEYGYSFLLDEDVQDDQGYDGWNRLRDLILDDEEVEDDL